MRVSIVCLSRAVGAQAKEFNRVLNLGVTVRLRNRRNPLFKFFNTQILGSSAIAAHQVVVMRMSIALAIQGLALAPFIDEAYVSFFVSLAARGGGVGLVRARGLGMISGGGQCAHPLLAAEVVA